MSEHSITREHFFKMIELQTQTMRDLYEENIQLRKDVALLAQELDNTLGALICKESYQEEYIDANLDSLEILVGKHSKNECELRIKPQKVKRWIGVFPWAGLNNYVTPEHFETQARLDEYISYIYGDREYQPIEIEVEES